MKTSEQRELELDIKKGNGPVECLGMTFEDDEARRAYFTDRLKEKLKDPAFREIEGFPIGDDDAILALSDPPYHTACPNPWLADFVKHYAKPSKPTDQYHREPFVADVKENKHHPIYIAHTYHTKVPHRAIMRYLLHYTQPGDFILDAFAGTGMTGIAAQLCGDSSEIEQLGYRVGADGTIFDEQSRPISKLGARNCVLSDLSPAATFVAYNHNHGSLQEEYRKLPQLLFGAIEDEFGWMFNTLHTPDSSEIVAAADTIRKSANRDLRQGFRVGTVNYTIWSEVFVCSECAGDVVFWESAVDKDRGKVRGVFECPHCDASLVKRGLQRSFETSQDQTLNEVIRQARTVPVRINYTHGGKSYNKTPDDADIALLEAVEALSITDWRPSDRMPIGRETRRNDPFGLTHFHHFYTNRNLAIFAAAWARLPLSHKWIVTGCLHRGSKQHQVAITRIGGEKAGVGGATAGHRRGTLYVPSNQIEMNGLALLMRRASAISKALSLTTSARSVIGSTQSASSLDLPAASIDYFFFDPPFGANISYSELNSTTEAWLRVATNSSSEAIEDSAQGKGVAEYKQLIGECFNRVYDMLKPGRWLTVEFSNTQAAIWNAIQTAIQEAGFVVANVSALSKGRGGLMAITGPTAVKQDLAITAYKPNGGLEDRFSDVAETEMGVWEFIRTHLGNLPVSKPRGGLMEPIAERDPRILYDHVVAFYVRHGISVPLSSPEFQVGLADRFPERDGMYFLPDQAANYDKMRMKMEGLGQLSIFVEDERSAVDWLRNFLKWKPSKYQDIQPEFFEKLNEAWKKWETRPELRALLDQYFLCYNGQGDLPPQIHGYLSTNFKDLRKLSADAPALRSKAKDRWYVPDPRKNADVEKLREKRLLEEFWTYLPPGYDVEAVRRRVQGGQETLPGMESPPPRIPKGKRLKLVRTEAVRVGFKQCYQVADYPTIIAVAHYIPEDVVNGDDQLQMIYDSAVTRSGLEI